MAVSERAERVFDLSGGALCLDFVNTLDDRLAARPRELLASYADLLAFAQATGALAPEQVAALQADAARRPADADVALAEARALRAALFQLFLALAEGRPASADDLARLNAALGAALRHARVVPAGRRGGDGVPPAGFAWAWDADAVTSDLAAPLWPVARSAAELLTAPGLGALRACAAEDCAWLFLDTSRNGSRRWCSMRTCGNRVKARRHYARVRAPRAAER